MSFPKAIKEIRHAASLSFWMKKNSLKLSVKAFKPSEL